MDIDKIRFLIVCGFDLMIGESYTYTEEYPKPGSINYFIQEIIAEHFFEKKNLLVSIKTDNKEKLLKIIDSSVTDSNQRRTNDYLSKVLGKNGFFYENIKNLVKNLDIKDTTNDTYISECLFHYPTTLSEVEKAMLESVFASVSEHHFFEGKITVSDTEYGKKISIKT